MPRGDNTGPNGMGPMTGRGLGFCNGYESPGFSKSAPRGGAGFGRGFGYGFGRGYGRGFRNYRFSNIPYFQAQNYSQIDEQQYISSEIDTLKQELKALEARLSELKKDE